MWNFLDKLEVFEKRYLLAAIKIYLINNDSENYIPHHVKHSLDNWQEDLTGIIRHYINFDEIILPPQAI